MLATHGGPLLLGTVLAAYGIPRTALLLVGGHLSDRWRPWTLMMATDAVRAIGVGALAVTAALEGLRRGAGAHRGGARVGRAGLFMPGSFAIVPALLDGDDLQAGNALISGGTQLATLIGPGHSAGHWSRWSARRRRSRPTGPRSWSRGADAGRAARG